jgi:hypothetical protein
MARTPAQTTVDPLAYQSILGSTFAKHDHQPLITIGPRSWTRWQLGRLGAPHPSAANKVQRVIQTLRIKTVEDFVARASEFGHFQTIGVTCYWVVLALVADCGGDIVEAHGAEKSFGAVHSAALKAQAPTAADTKSLGPSDNGASKKRPRKRKL